MIYIYTGYLCESLAFHCSEILCIPSNWVCNGDKDCPDGRDEDQSICSKSLSGSSYFLSRKNTYDLVVKSLRHSHEKLPTKTTGFSGK